MKKNEANSINENNENNENTTSSNQKRCCDNKKIASLFYLASVFLGLGALGGSFLVAEKIKLDKERAVLKEKKELLSLAQEELKTISQTQHVAQAMLLDPIYIRVLFPHLTEMNHENSKKHFQDVNDEMNKVFPNKQDAIQILSETYQNIFNESSVIGFQELILERIHSSRVPSIETIQNVTSNKTGDKNLALIQRKNNQNSKQ